MAKKWQPEYRRKDGTFVSGHWAEKTKPKRRRSRKKPQKQQGCEFWLLGLSLAVLGLARLRSRRRSSE